MALRSRLAPDPSVGVGDLVAVFKDFKDWMQEESCQDIGKLLHSQQKISWKGASDGDWLGSNSLSNLFCKLFNIHKNAVMSSQKIKTAFLKCQTQHGRLNFSKLHDADWADNMDDKLRMAAAHYRDLKKDPVKYHRSW